MDEGLIPRIGTFFILIGTGMAILFFASLLILMEPNAPRAEAGPARQQALANPQTSPNYQDISFMYLGGAVILLGLGALMRRKAAPPPPSGRFSGFKNLLARRNKKGDSSKKK